MSVGKHYSPGALKTGAGTGSIARQAFFNAAAPPRVGGRVPGIGTPSSRLRRTLEGMPRISQPVLFENNPREILPLTNLSSWRGIRTPKECRWPTDKKIPSTIYNLLIVCCSTVPHPAPGFCRLHRDRRQPRQFAVAISNISDFHGAIEKKNVINS